MSTAVHFRSAVAFPLLALALLLGACSSSDESPSEPVSLDQITTETESPIAFRGELKLNTTADTEEPEIVPATELVADTGTSNGGATPNCTWENEHAYCTVSSPDGIAQIVVTEPAFGVEVFNQTYVSCPTSVEYDYNQVNPGFETDITLCSGVAGELTLGPKDNDAPQRASLEASSVLIAPSEPEEGPNGSFVHCERQEESQWCFIAHPDGIFRVGLTSQTTDEILLSNTYASTCPVEVEVSVLVGPDWADVNVIPCIPAQKTLTAG